MKNTVFADYSKFYDLLYNEKPYEKEVFYLNKIIRRFSKFPTKTILSLGCGTCSHEIYLAKQGYSITGIDRSSEMLTLAETKIEKEKLKEKISLIKGNVEYFNIKKKFDVCMAMFNIAGYLNTDKSFERMLKKVNLSLLPGGIFMFDCWNKKAVLRNGPLNRLKEVELTNKKIFRFTRSRNNKAKDLIEIDFQVVEVINDFIVKEVKEKHLMRYWEVVEMKKLLKKNGFSTLLVCDYLDSRYSFSGKKWDIFFVARKEK